MQLKTLLAFTLFWLALSAFAQSPVLVQDFNSGENDSYNFFNFQGITFQDHLIFPIVGDDIGEEVAVVTNGELAVLKDVNPGMASSQPKYFTEFQGKVFFSAFDATNGGALWVTDGTPDGTTLFFDPGTHPTSTPQGLIVSASGYLYYTYDGELFRTDGQENESVFDGVAFTSAYVQASNNYTTYGEEIAFLTQAADDTVRLYTVAEGTAVLLAQTTETSNFADVFGLSEVEAGLVFGVDDSFNGEVNGTYVYQKSDGILSKLDISGASANRLHPFTTGQALGWFGNLGYYGINGVSGEEELLYASSNLSATQGTGIQYAAYQDKMVFAVSEGFFGDDFLVYSDGTAAGTQNLFEISSYISNILTAGQYAFIASGTSNGFRPELYYVDLEDGSYKNFYNFNQSSVFIDAILLLGVQNDRLYFLSNLDTSIGRELYYIDLDIEVTTAVRDNRIEPAFEVQLTPTTFEVLAEEFGQVRVHVFTQDGRLLESLQTPTHQRYDISHLHGFLLLQFELNGQMQTRKFFRP
ncbi:hypothetical protein [Flavilitoribacter nigricans]|uniref:T9SS type A sorting domain-containing protein n=1 Tax=Flavilitoribacter nigricans (strain ATCC 23147 / DSM 23189 / NBRC 102662 / NCIMB 1420 / SS-2) TaxID=1122177 RepID=A0A2D0NES3_FLAN2|nr:hypothetical protein [Flavilitoribacter nigricans]PHN06977.1 hypothetical protein CRP01_08430 [Flavilitoribacter nigricans DSM 23189 = NBRC 102662]